MFHKLRRRLFTAAAGLPPLLFLLFQRALPESPLYLYNRGRHKEAKAVLDTMATVNKVSRGNLGSFDV